MEEKYWQEIKEKAEEGKRKKLPRSNVRAPSPLKGKQFYRSKFAEECPNFYELSPKQKNRVSRDRFLKIMSFDVNKEVN